VESVLDRVRADELQIDAELASLFLESCDQISALVNQVAGEGGDEAALAETSKQLIARLDRYLAAEAAAAPAAQAAARQQQASGPRAGCEHWHISLRFGADVLRNGMDPLSFLRYLKT